MKNQSVKQRSIKTGVDEDQDYFDSLIRINRQDYSPGETARRAHLSLARTKICRGGLGSGKSRFGTEHVNNLALRYPGSTHFIGRKDLTSLKETTQREFLEKVVDRATIDSFHVNDNKLFYKNGSQVLFRETKEPDKVKSLELTSYMLDECDENGTDEIWDKLDDRLRQKIWMNGGWVEPPFSGLLVFNPTDERHWLYSLAIRKDIDVEDFRFSTYENLKNLPADYIPNLIKKLPPWDVNRLVHGHWGKTIRGNPVYHGFNRSNNVRALQLNDRYPLLVGWDFGYGHPAITWAQLDPSMGRFFLIREFLGTNMKLEDVVERYKQVTNELIGATHYPIFHYGDPHGADEKDVGLSSIEYLRVHHNIHVIHRRERIKTGMEEIQHKISTQTYQRPPAPNDPDPNPIESLFLVDVSCKEAIAAMEGGYHRDEEGVPVKDGYYDHVPDTLRYIIVNTMNQSLKLKHRQRKFNPRNLFTGY